MPRYIERFDSIDGAISYTFPLAQAQQQIEQAYRTPLTPGVGANYAYDHLGYGVSPKDPRRISIRALHHESSQANLQTEIDEAQAECYRIGLGYLYRLDVDGSTYRRCIARLTSAPSITFDGNFQFGVAPVVFNFVGLSDWYATSQTTGSRSVSAGQTAVTITSPGNIPVFSGIVFTLTFTAVTTYVVIRNTTNGSEMRWDGYADVDDVLVFGNPDGFVGHGGPSFEIGGGDIGAGELGADIYPNDFASVTLGDSGFVYLEPGANQIIVETDGAFTLDDAHYGGFA